jgi:hypothetical protein
MLTAIRFLGLGFGGKTAIASPGRAVDRVDLRQRRKESADEVDIAIEMLLTTAEQVSDEGGCAAGSCARAGPAQLDRLAEAGGCAFAPEAPALGVAASRSRTGAGDVRLRRQRGVRNFVKPQYRLIRTPMSFAVVASLGA